MMDAPNQDPTQILDDLRMAYLSQLLIAGTARFDVATALKDAALPYAPLREKLGLQDRPAIVLLTGLRSMGLIDVDADHSIALTPYGREKLSTDSQFNLRGYIGLGAFGADAQSMMHCLENDAPAGSFSFVYHAEAGPSALDDPQMSDALTRAMAARARNVAPYVARQLDLSTCQHLVDVGGGHGIYTIELLMQFPKLTATIVDREPPLKVAREYANQAGLSQRIEFVFADIHTYQLPTPTDVVLLANILHDYSATDAGNLVQHFAQQLPTAGQLVILDAFLEAISAGAPPIARGPRAVAAYSAMLFTICEGRCYRLDEYQSMMSTAGLQVQPDVKQVPAHGSLLTGIR
jgi:predicted O-methyltransferase YrrM